MISLLFGALLRAFWGGWNPIRSFKWSKLEKFPIVFSSVFVAAFFTVGNIPFAAFASVMIGGIICFPEYHGWSMGMGTVPGRPLYLCVLGFWLNYWLAMMITGYAWFYFVHDKAGMVYGLLGILTPLGHIAAQWIDRTFKPNYAPYDQGYFWDGATRMGECWLGAVLFSFPLAKVIYGLF